jgi:hypothetical protein
MAVDMSNILYVLISIVVSVIVNSLFVWFAGRILVGGDKAKFSDAVWIVVLGAVIGGIIGAFIHGLLASVVMFILWLALIKHFFDCGWIKALIIDIVAIIIQIIIAFILGLLFGVTIMALGI